MSFLTTSVQHCTEDFGHYNRAREINTIHNNWNGMSKMLSFTDDMFVYVQRPKELGIKQPELISEFSKSQNTRLLYKMNCIFIQLGNEIKTF